MAADKEKTLAFKISIEGVSQEQIQLQKLEQNLKNLKKERLELLELSKKEGIMSNDTAAKLAAYDNEIKRLTENKKMLAKVAGTATDSLTRMRAELIQMKKQAADGSQELNAKMTPAIKKLSDEIQKLEAAQGAHQRNVGNYAEAFAQAPGPIGKATYALKGFGETAKALLLNPVVLAIGALSMALAGLYKVFVSTAEGAGMMKEATAIWKAELDVARDRAISLIDSVKLLFKGEYTEAALKYAQAVDSSGKAMAYAAEEAARLSKEQRALNKEMAFAVSLDAQENLLIQENLYLSKDKSKSDQERLGYLKEALQLGEEKAARERNFAQRQFEIDSEAAALKAKQSGVDAEVIREWIALDEEKQMQALKNSKQLQDMYNRLGGSSGIRALEESYAVVIEKETEFFAHNKRAISQMSGLEQELQDEWVKNWEERYKLAEDLNKRREQAAKEKKKQEAQDMKESLELAKYNLAAEDKMRKEYADRWKKMVEEEKAQGNFKLEFRKLLGIKEADLGLQQNKKLAEEQEKQIKASQEYDKQQTKETEDKKLAIKMAALDGAKMGADAAFESRRNRLQAEMTAELANENLTEQQRTQIRKRYAKEQQKLDVKQAIINGALAIGNAMATSKPFFPMAIIGSAMAALQTGIQIAAIKSQAFATGGKIAGGAMISQDQTKDNTLILAKQGEVVLNENQQRKLGGSRTFKRIGVPGFEAGGVIGMPYPEADGNTMEQMLRSMAQMINDKKVILEINKLNSAQKEESIITQPSAI